MGIPYVENQHIKVSHTAFYITPEQYIVTSCYNCSGPNGTVQVWDYTNNLQPRKLLDINGNSSSG